MDLTMFVNAVRTRVGTLSTEEVQTLFAHLPSTPVCLRFKIALCRLSLADPSAGGDSKPKRRPQASKPAPIRKQASDVLPDSTLTESSPGPAFIRKPTPIAVSEIMRLFTNSERSSDTDELAFQRELQLKFYLILTFGELQEQVPLAEKDPAWLHLVQGEDLARAIETAFTPSGVAMGVNDQALAQDLRQMLSLVSISWRR